MRRSKRSWWWLLATIPLAALAWFGRSYLDGRSQASDADATQQVVMVARGNVTASIDPTGQVEAMRSVQLSFDVDRVTLLEIRVSAGQQVSQGDILAVVDVEPLQQAAQQAEANMLSAQAALEAAQNPYSTLDVRKAALDVSAADLSLREAQEALAELQVVDLAEAQSALSEAERTLREAREELASLQDDSSVQEQIDVLQWRYNVAELNYVGLQNQAVWSEEGEDKKRLAYNKMMDAQDTLETARLRAQLDLLNAHNAVAEAERGLAEAQDKLAEQAAGPAEVALAQARNRVAQAEYNLAAAHDKAATIAAGPSETDIRKAQATYNDATAALSEAQAALDGASMVAPFDATVISVGAEEGDLVSSSNAIVTLADLSVLRVVAAIDETEITKVRAGMAATITFDSLPNRTFVGAVLEVPLESTLSSNVVTYAVPISLGGTEGTSLRSGMTANVSLITGERQDVLLVPILAVQESDDGNVVTLADGSTTRVELGINDGQYVEVTRGLMEGDQVLVQYEASSDEGFSFGMPAVGEIRIENAGPGGGGQPPAMRP